MNRPTGPREWKVGTSTFLFGGLTEADLAACKDGGLDCVEVCLFGKRFDRMERDMEPYCKKLAALGADLGMEFWSVHLPFGQTCDISSLNEDERSATIKRQSDLLRLAGCLRPHKAVIHASSEPIEPAFREKRLESCMKSLSELAGIADQTGIQLAVECLPRTCLGNDSVEMARLVGVTELLGICCDTNHLLTERTEGFIRKMGSKVVTLHVSDYDMIDERHWMPGLGANDWNAVIEALVGVGYEGPVMFEVGQHNPDNLIRPVHLRQCWDKMLEEYEAAQV